MDDPSPTSPPDELNLPLIIGASVAGAVVLLVFIFLFFRCRRKNQSSQQTQLVGKDSKGGRKSGHSNPGFEEVDETKSKRSEGNHCNNITKDNGITSMQTKKSLPKANGTVCKDSKQHSTIEVEGKKESNNNSSRKSKNKKVKTNGHVITSENPHIETEAVSSENSSHEKQEILVVDESGQASGYVELETVPSPPVDEVLSAPGMSASNSPLVASASENQKDATLAIPAKTDSVKEQDVSQDPTEEGKTMEASRPSIPPVHTLKTRAEKMVYYEKRQDQETGETTCPIKAAKEEAARRAQLEEDKPHTSSEENLETSQSQQGAGDNDLGTPQINAGDDNPKTSEPKQGGSDSDLESPPRNSGDDNPETLQDSSNNNLETLQQNSRDDNSETLHQNSSDNSLEIPLQNSSTDNNEKTPQQNSSNNNLESNANLKSDHPVQESSPVHGDILDESKDEIKNVIARKSGEIEHSSSDLQADIPNSEHGEQNNEDAKTQLPNGRQNLDKVESDLHKKKDDDSENVDVDINDITLMKQEDGIPEVKTLNASNGPIVDNISSDKMSENAQKDSSIVSPKVEVNKVQNTPRSVIVANGVKNQNKSGKIIEDKKSENQTVGEQKARTIAMLEQIHRQQLEAMQRASIPKPAPKHTVETNKVPPANGDIARYSPPKRKKFNDQWPPQRASLNPTEGSTRFSMEEELQRRLTAPDGVGLKAGGGVNPHKGPVKRKSYGGPQS